MVWCHRFFLLGMLMLAACKTPPVTPPADAQAPPTASDVFVADTAPAGRSFWIVMEDGDPVLGLGAPLLVGARNALYAPEGGALVRRTDLDPLAVDEITEITSFGKDTILVGAAIAATPKGRSTTRTRGVDLLREGGAWRNLDANRPKALYIHGVGPWLDGSLLMLEGEDVPAMQLVAGHAAGPLPRQALDRAKKGPRLRFARLATLPTGEVFAIGEDSNQSLRSAIVERWKAHEETSVIEDLPRPKGNEPPTLTCIHARSPTEVWVGGMLSDHGRPPMTPYLTRFDGRAWSLITPPAKLGTEIQAMDSGPDGTLWVLGDTLFALAPSGAWTERPIPTPTLLAEQDTMGQSALRVMGDDDVWLQLAWAHRRDAESELEYHAIVAHTRPPAFVLDGASGRHRTFADVATRWALPGR